MSNNIKKIGVLTSGGDSPGMNAAIRAIVKTCLNKSIQPVGYFDGYDGVISNSWKELTFSDVDNIIQRGGTILGTARSETFRTKEGRSVAIKNLLDNNIDGFICIGGDGSFTGASILSDEMNIPVIGIPGTIDNDIFGTSHTLGFDTALNTVVECIDKIRDTASSHNRLFLVEVMGRDAGHIALNAGIGAGAEEILIPEQDLGLERLLESLRKSKASGKSSSIVVIAEGDKIGKSVFELKDYIEENMPEYDIRVSVLGHMQRGGAPSCFDRVLASRLGVKAVESILEGKSNYMVGILNDKVALTPIENAIKGHSEIDQELLRVSDIMST